MWWRAKSIDRAGRGARGKQEEAMARGRTQRTIQSEESQKMLMVDSGYPPMVKAQLRMLARGGRLPAQQCLVCQTRRGAMFLEVFIPAGALSPIPGDEAKPQTYFTCRKDHDTPVDAGE